MRLLNFIAGIFVSVFMLPSTGSSVQAGMIIASGDEWLLSNDAYTNNNADTVSFASNIINQVGGERYLIYTNAPAVFAYGTSFQNQATSSGKSVTVDTTSTFSSSLIQDFDVLFLGGTLGSGQANAVVLTDYVNAGGVVYLSLGTQPSAATEATIWNPFLNAFNLSAGGVYFTDQTTQTFSIAAGNHPLRQNVGSIRWGYGQEIGIINPLDTRSQIAIYGEFGAPTGTRGVLAVTSGSPPSVPEPSTMAIFGLGAIGMAYRARRKAKA